MDTTVSTLKSTFSSELQSHPKYSEFGDSTDANAELSGYLVRTFACTRLMNKSTR